jgi:tRNA threonylcarbamoyladenosine biosynthesis protein TsaE
MNSSVSLHDAQGLSRMKLIQVTHSPKETFDLGNLLGTLVPAGVVLAITGVLGSGKTLFVQGLAKGLNVPESIYVTSPSYTLINEYPGRLTLVHADLYRLTGSADIESTGLYHMMHTDCVVAIEWAERMPREDLGAHVAVCMDIEGETVRRIQFAEYGQQSNNLLRELGKRMKEYKWH